MARHGAPDHVIDPQLGRRIRDARIAAGLTQAELATDTVSVGYISRIESGLRRPGATALHRIARRLNITVEELSGQLSQADRSSIQLAVDYAELALSGGEVDRAYEAATAAAAQAGRVGAESLRLRALHVQALAEEARGNLDEAVIILEDVLSVGPPGSLAADCGIALSRCYRDSGDLDRAISSGEQVLALMRRRGDEGTPEFVRLSVTVAGAYAEQGDISHAIRLGRRCIKAAERIASPEALAAAYWNASTFEHDRGDISAAIELATKALTLLHSGGDSNRNLARLRTMLGQLYLKAPVPDVEQAQELLTAAATEMAWTAASPADVAENVIARAKASALAGDHHEALHLLEDFPQAAADHTPLLDAEKLALRGAILLATGDSVGALASYDRALLAAEVVGSGQGVGQIWFQLGRAYRELGRFDQACAALDRAAQLCGASEYELPVAPIQGDLSRLTSSSAESGASSAELQRPG
jgi:tetratricopeptide (TPR) repeat protein